MAIFRYTFFKYLKAPSTWVILLLSMFIAGFIGGYLPMSALNFKAGQTIAQNYAILVIAVGGGVTAFLSIFMSVFAGFKGASMFRDEVEDGTFLVMLSKPQSRAKIIFQKWFALQVIMLAYSFLSVLAFVVCIEIFDKGDSIPSLAAIGIGTLKSSIFKIGGFIWAILIVVGLIFSSIAILMSTRLSAGATVGISISLGVIIPITGMVSMFTAKQEYTHIKNPTFQRMGLLLQTTAASTEDQIAKIVSMTTSQQLGSAASSKDIESVIDKIKPEIKAFFDVMANSFKTIDNPNAIYNIAISSGKTDKFKNIWGFDLNYQLRQMASVVTNSMVPESLKPQLKALPSSKLSGMQLTNKIVGTPVTPTGIQDWIEQQVKDDIKVQLEWGLAGKKIITALAGIFEVKDKNGNIVPTQSLVEKLLTSPNLPQNWVIPNEIRDYLNQDLVKTTLQLIHKAIYDPMQNMFSSATLFAAASAIDADWETKVTMTRPKGAPAYVHPSELDHYAVIYKQVYSSITGVTDADSIETDRNDARAYAALRFIIEKNPGQVKFVETTDYIPGMTLLYIYLGIALALVPISYLVVRKQDFR